MSEPLHGRFLEVANTVDQLLCATSEILTRNDFFRNLHEEGCYKSDSHGIPIVPGEELEFMFTQSLLDLGAALSQANVAFSLVKMELLRANGARLVTEDTIELCSSVNGLFGPFRLSSLSRAQHEDPEKVGRMLGIKLHTFYPGLLELTFDPDKWMRLCRNELVLAAEQSPAAGRRSETATERESKLPQQFWDDATKSQKAIVKALEDAPDFRIRRNKLEDTTGCFRNYFPSTETVTRSLNRLNEKLLEIKWRVDWNKDLGAVDSDIWLVPPEAVRDVPRQK